MQARLPEAFLMSQQGGGLDPPTPTQGLALAGTRHDAAEMTSPVRGSAGYFTPASALDMQCLLHHQQQQQAAALAGGQLGGALGSPGSFAGQPGSLDPAAAVYAAVGRNFSPGDASLLSPWGRQQQQQQQQAAATGAFGRQAIRAAAGLHNDDLMRSLPQV